MKKKVRGPEAIQELLQNRTHVGIRSIKGEKDLSTRARMNKLRNRGKDILGTAEGGVQRVGDQAKDLPEPLRAAVRGARTPAPPRGNFLQKFNIPKNLWRAGLSEGEGKAKEKGGDGGKMLLQGQTSKS